VLIIIALAAFAGIQIAWVFDPLVLTARAILWNLIPAVNLFVDKLFVFILKAAGQTVAGYNAHEILKNSFLAGKTAYFVNVPFIPVFFLAVIIPSLFLSRFWCRIFCPLGGIYSIFAGYSLMERVTVGCVNCGQCDKYCRMGAINKDGSYRKGECVLCMDCVYMCKACAVKFNFKRDKPGRSLSSDTGNKKGITRKDFLFLLAGSFLALGLKRKKKTVSAYPGNLIRPPGVIDEKQFFNRCVRCGNCMRICPTNVLQPVLLEAGIEGIWTPHLVNEIGYCEYNCNSCGEVCPTGAIPELKLHIKQKTKIGIARIDRDKCVAWAENRQCLVCEKYCPVAGKAIKIDNIVIEGKVVGRPVVDTEACIGCGICQNKCPVRPERAVKIYPGPAR
jgi:MauM/NapG family ferredoxin protein